MTASEPAARVEWLAISGEPENWRSLGLTISDRGVIPLPGTALQVRARGGEPGLTGWAISGPAMANPPGLLDGLATEWVAPQDPMWATHRLGAIGLDHVVVLTDQLERTSDAIAAATGCELKRIREIGTMRQGFHRIGRGGLIVELVERPEVPADTTSFWGLVMDVEDLDVAFERLGPELLGEPKDAVQPGRRIATVREAAGLGLPVALMDTPRR